ncbi:MAG: hypothetical protein KDN22_31925 [Verrucomicrobiae bacterium]|nr:hypothetical protein [Verrucomicrobiae bacterium]
MSTRQPYLFRLRYLFITGIVVVLLWVGVGLLDRLRTPSTRMASLAHAKQIYLALAEFAIDYDGTYPLAFDDSNSAYRQLFSERFNDERLFFEPENAWHDSLPAGSTGPDCKIGTAPDYSEALTQGENHWAYYNGLNNGSRGNLPLIMDGFTENVGIYSLDPHQIGGIVGDKGVTIVRADGSGMMSRPDADGKIRTRRDGHDVDFFSSEGGTDSDRLHNPL